MKLAIIGSRNLTITNLEDYIPPETTEIVSGGAKGIDTCAAEYARSHDLPLTEFLPDYARYKRGAPLKRNEQIIAYADRVLIFWDGSSKGTLYCINLCRTTGKPAEIIRLPAEKEEIQKA
ncbi:MAG: DUF2493 domain-containing protein [Clostridia bacterium]|nr:DUF2493 domain-containing protein [Clostridia bacterium]